MSKRMPTRHVWRIMVGVATGVLLFGVWTRATLAQQQPAATATGGTAHAAAPKLKVGPAAGLGNRGLQPKRMPVPLPRPLILSRGTINGAAFTRPGTALAPLGGPAKPGATSINGTSIRPKH
jgi:hypothetical protein